VWDRDELTILVVVAMVIQEASAFIITIMIVYHLLEKIKINNFELFINFE